MRRLLKQLNREKYAGSPSTTFTDFPQPAVEGESSKTARQVPWRNGSKSGAGFTLIEMIVSVSIFTVVMFVTVGALLAIADANRKANALRTTMDNLNFATEAMARNIRTGHSYECEGSGNCASGGDSFTYIDQDGVRTTYRHNAQDQTVEIRRENGSFNSFTSPEVQVEDITFFVSNVGTDKRQPFVTISIQGVAGINDRVLTEFSVQTSVSQRRVEG